MMRSYYFLLGITNLLQLFSGSPWHIVVEVFRIYSMVQIYDWKLFVLDRNTWNLLNVQIFVYGKITKGRFFRMMSVSYLKLYNC